MKLAITGASGYIGAQLVTHALKAGHSVVALTRNQLRSPYVTWQRYELTASVPPSLPDDLDVLIHLAADTATSAPNIEVEINAAQALLEATNRVNARLIFVSSQTAREDAPTTYGRGKWQIEQLVLASGGWVVRPGLVYGGPQKGLYGILVKAVAHSPVLPIFLPAPQIQPIHIDDLCAAILTGIDKYSAISCIGSSTSVSFNYFLRLIAEVSTRRWRCWLPVPEVAIRFGHWLLGENLSNRLGLARLLSLFDLPRMECADDLTQLEISPRSLRAGLLNQRRAVLAEGRAMLGYVLREQPVQSLLRRYARCVEQLRGGQPLALPRCSLHYPSFLALLDRPPPKTASSEFAWRLDAAVVIAEASPQGCERFLLLKSSGGALKTALQIFRALMVESCWRVLGAIFSPWMKVKADQS